jgi:MFS transporter, SP family, arabinose:H+ symporter
MNKAFIFRASSVAAMGGMLFGFDTAVISGALPAITAFFRLDAKQLGWSVSVVLLGCALGALAAGAIADKYGRKFCLMICAILFAVSGIGAGLSGHLYLFVLFRFLGGLGVGAAAMVSPMYIAEISPPHLRGRLVAFYQLAIVSGILLAYFSDYLLNNQGPDSWRWMFGFQGAPAFLFFLMLIFVSETPRWLIRKGKIEQAALVLEQTLGSASVNEEIEIIQKSFGREGDMLSGKLFQRKYLPVTIVGIMLAIFQQVSGVNAVLYYAPLIFKEAGLNSTSSLLNTIGIGVANFASTFVAISLVDKVGRKKFLVTGSLLMGISLLAVAFCFQFSYFSHYIMLGSMLVYVATFGCTLGAVTWVYLSEIFPNAIRSKALSVTTLALWIADFIVAYTFPLITASLGIAGTMFCYAALCGLCFLYILFNIKETKGKALEQIEKLFIKN